MQENSDCPGKQIRRGGQPPFCRPPGLTREAPRSQASPDISRRQAATPRARESKNQYFLPPVGYARAKGAGVGRGCALSATPVRLRYFWHGYAFARPRPLLQQPLVISFPFKRMRALFGMLVHPPGGDGSSKCWPGRPLGWVPTAKRGGIWN